MNSFTFVSAPQVKSKSNSLLELESVMNKVWNPLFTTGTVLFISSMILRSFIGLLAGDILLVSSTFILLAGVWRLSAVALISFDKSNAKLFCVYKHLGYLSTEIVFPLASVQQVKYNHREIKILLDDGRIHFISRSNRFTGHKIFETAKTISEYLSVPLAKD